MSVWINLEALSNNDLPIPEYATKCSAGLDFAACLTRPCKNMQPNRVLGGCPEQFYVDGNGNRYDATGSRPQPSYPPPKIILHQYETILIPLGFKCEFNNGYVLKLYPRSSMGAKGMMLGNSVGVIDSDYRGELFACVYNRNNTPLIIEHGQRIVQGIMEQCYQAVIKCTNVSDTVRGEGGFGSTGH